MDDAISRQLAIDKFAAYIYQAFKDFYRIGLHRKTLTPEQCRRVARNVLAEVPSAQPDKEKISDALYYIYRNKGTSTSAEGVAAIKYYIAEIWREIYGEEGPKWLKK